MGQLIEINGRNITFMDEEGNYQFDSCVEINDKELYIDTVDSDYMNQFEDEDDYEENEDWNEEYNELMEEVHNIKNELLICLMINTVNKETNKLYIFENKLYSDRTLTKEIKIFSSLVEKLESYEYDISTPFKEREERWEKIYDEVFEIITNIKV
jgi:hypothetical protein